MIGVIAALHSLELRALWQKSRKFSKMNNFFLSMKAVKSWTCPECGKYVVTPYADDDHICNQ